ncbi:arylsulfatase A-like enzyme [Arthrobacter stackebrandtii]|uniref:Arylsulfatase A-like enzyme n=1 Tax=Arthrobacter stackebrandtii TaxID=272161 RepID=A0ABS4YSY4_9MICC|nr:sulfatase-like hydrolase/transferase [Arthrobacter stackebrandtii]MBP2411910.1 arylsulfatase A-like enzyme [Arthrobacter stackebrandtii]PYG99063.1 sulfatase [Arthrobacter stackebrandtii]
MPTTATTRQPNIIVIVSDDHGYADRSILGVQDDVQTPCLDRLAQEGASYTNAYVTAPICSPSRAGLAAGQYQQRWGARWFTDSEIGPESVPTMAELLRGEGYTTGYFGKVHYGTEHHGDRGTPPQHGYDESFYGLAGESMGRLNYLHHSEDAVEEYGEAAFPMAVQPLWNGEEPQELEGFLTDAIGERTRQFVAEHADKPFLATVAFNAVHNFCWQLPAEELQKRGLPAYEDWNPGAGQYIDWYDGAISPHLENGRAYYLAQLELMDAQIGLILDQLDELGLAEDTIVVYLTDNGGSTCNYGVNLPLRGTKYTLWEGGVRVPFLLRWPGRVPAGAVREGLTSSMDILPTAMAAAGADPAAYATSDGLNLLATDGHETLHWDCGWQWSVRRGDWKLHWVEPGSPVAEAIRDVEHAEPGSGYFLCNLAADPAETTNLYDAEPTVAAELAALHAAWVADVGQGEAAAGPAAKTDS